MAEKFLMPKLSPTMEEGQISRWVKNEGDAFDANETLAEVDTDKATMEMTSLTAGTLLKIIVPAGENARLGQIIGVLGKPGEDYSDILADAEAEGSGSSAATADEEPAKAEEAVPTPAPAAAATPAPASNGNSGGRILVSPIAARMASENGIDLKTIAGSGPSGRIIKRDIEKALEAPQPATMTAAPAFTFGKTADIQGASAYREENTSPMRRTIAHRLTESIGPIPTFYLTVEIEMDGTLETRKQINAAIAPAKISVNDFIIKAAAEALTRHPFVNASYADDRIRFYEDADIGVAVAVEEGLITPVVRGANRKGFAQISAEVAELAEKARSRKLQPEEYTGATFSISNLGMFGIKEFTAIINPPEAAILAVGKAEPVPVVRNGEIVVRNIMHVTMSCDHRVVDGATGAKFLETFKQMLENPAMMLV